MLTRKVWIGHRELGGDLLQHGDLGVNGELFRRGRYHGQIAVFIQHEEFLVGVDAVGLGKAALAVGDFSRSRLS